MVFSSLTFLLLFTDRLTVYFVGECKIWWRNAVLLTASLLFYAWGEPVFVLVMLFVNFTSYVGTLVSAAEQR
ncbi:MAG: hypothetical protein R2881_03480 [Eubacteriales bacterium]